MATRARGRARSSPALALAGGGGEGAVYEIGALRALDEAVDGLDVEALPLYVGVSAGAFVAACLANRIRSAQLCRAVVSPQPGEHPFQPQTFFSPAVGEILKRGATLPGRLLQALHDYLRHPEDVTLLESLVGLARALPVGLFDNDPIRAFLHRSFSIKGRTDDFRELPCRLFLLATELCTARRACFGEPGLDHVPISRAVQASTAFPGLYPPVVIEGKYYVDGVLRKTLNASTALSRGARLVICINPIVPIDVEECGHRPVIAGSTLIERGLPGVLSQTFRTVIHSRMTLGLAAYDHLFPGADVVVFEPGPGDVQMFVTNIFSFSERKAVLEHAYRTTRRELLRRADELEPVFARHGLHLRRDVLREERDLWREVGVVGKARPPVVVELGRALDRLESLL